MRRCGRRYATKAAALRSKLYLAGGRTVATCPDPACGGVHLRKAEAPKATPRPAAAHPFPAAVATLIDARDVDLLTGERCCQSCGSTENLERHHRRLKGMGGSDDRAHAQCACNGLTLCRREHRGRNGVHRGIRKLAEAMGFIVPQQVDEPGQVGVMRFAATEGGATQFATCDGRWVTEAPAGAHSAPLRHQRRPARPSRCRSTAPATRCNPSHQAGCRQGTSQHPRGNTK